MVTHVKEKSLPRGRRNTEINTKEALAAIGEDELNREWISKSMAQLRRDFLGEYVAVGREHGKHRVMAHHPDYEALLAMLARKHVPPGSVTIQRITPGELSLAV